MPTSKETMINYLRHAVWIAAMLCSYINTGAQDFVLRKYATHVERDVVYGTAVGFDGTTDTLRLNYYKPVGDGNRRRPLIIWVHGGGFTGGSRTDFETLAEAYAQRGYVAATISYRLGFYPPAFLSNPYAYDTAEVVRAAYRASQDLYGAIRFLVSRAALDSINPSFVVFGGASAGGITALQAGFIGEHERYPDTRAIGDVPNTVSPARPDLGPPTGTLHTDVATPRVLAVVNLFGAIPDTSFIESANDPALYQYHQTGDPLVSCQYARGLWGYPGGVPDHYYYVHGSCNIKPRLEHLGYTAARHRSWIYEGNGHDFHDPFALELEIAAFLAPLVADAVSSVTDDHVRVNANQTAPLAATEIIATSNGPVQVFDLTGRVMYEGSVAVGEPLPTLPPGPYVVKSSVETRFILIHR